MYVDTIENYNSVITVSITHAYIDNVVEIFWHNPQGVICYQRSALTQYMYIHTQKHILIACTHVILNKVAKSETEHSFTFTGYVRPVRALLR